MLGFLLPFEQELPLTFGQEHDVRANNSRRTKELMALMAGVIILDRLAWAMSEEAESELEKDMCRAFMFGFTGMGLMAASNRMNLSEVANFGILWLALMSSRVISYFLNRADDNVADIELFDLDSLLIPKEDKSYYIFFESALLLELISKSLQRITGAIVEDGEQIISQMMDQMEEVVKAIRQSMDTREEGSFMPIYGLSDDSNSPGASPHPHTDTIPLHERNFDEIELA